MAGYFVLGVDGQFVVWLLVVVSSVGVGVCVWRRWGGVHGLFFCVLDSVGGGLAGAVGHCFVCHVGDWGHWSEEEKRKGNQMGVRDFYVAWMSFFPRGGSLVRRVLIGCVDVDRYIRATLCVVEFSTVDSGRDFCSGSNDVIKNEMRVLEVRFILINSLLLSI